MKYPTGAGLNLNFKVLNNQVEVISKYKFDLNIKEWVPQ